MTDVPWRATSDGIAIACRLTPKGGRDAMEGVATLSDGARVVLACGATKPYQTCRRDGGAERVSCEVEG